MPFAHGTSVGNWSIAGAATMEGVSPVIGNGFFTDHEDADKNDEEIKGALREDLPTGGLRQSLSRVRPQHS